MRFIGDFGNLREIISGKDILWKHKDALLFLLPILSGILGSYLTYYFAQKSKRDETMLRFKEEKYSALLVLLQGFVGATTSGDIKRRFFEEQYRSWIYSSVEVVKAINKMVQLVIDSHGNKPESNKDGRQSGISF